MPLHNPDPDVPTGYGRELDGILRDTKKHAYGYDVSVEVHDAEVWYRIKYMLCPAPYCLGEHERDSPRLAREALWRSSEHIQAALADRTLWELPALTMGGSGRSRLVEAWLTVIVR